MKTEEIRDFLDYFGEFVEWFALGEEDAIEAAYEADVNHKHADVTDPRTCYTMDELEELFEEALEYRKKYSSEHCDDCGAYLAETDFRVVNEARPAFWGAPCSECVAEGYICSNCGHEERF